MHVDLPGAEEMQADSLCSLEGHSGWSWRVPSISRKVYNSRNIYIKCFKVVIKANLPSFPFSFSSFLYRCKDIIV